MNKIIAATILTSLSNAHGFTLDYHPTLSAEAQMKIEQFYKDKNVLVTGGCGFIGSHLAQKLVSLGANVTIIDDLSTGSLDNIAEFKHKITFMKESIVDQAVCDRAAQGAALIFHLAAYTSVPGSVKDPLICHTINNNGTFNVLQAAKQHQVKRFIFSSTSAVYGPREDICYETDTHLEPVSPYGATKLMGELYCKQFALLFDVPCVMLRYFNVHGPRQNPNSQYAAVVAKFKQNIEHHEPITIFGDGMQTRDFVHVHDVVDANLLVGMASEKMVSGQSYNIGSGTSISVLELADAMKKEFPEYTEETKFAPARGGDVKHTQMSGKKFNILKNKFFTLS